MEGKGDQIHLMSDFHDASAATAPTVEMALRPSLTVQWRCNPLSQSKRRCSPPLSQSRMTRQVMQLVAAQWQGSAEVEVARIFSDHRKPLRRKIRKQRRLIGIICLAKNFARKANFSFTKLQRENFGEEKFVAELEKEDGREILVFGIQWKSRDQLRVDATTTTTDFAAK
jgi:hypothetical protein